MKGWTILICCFVIFLSITVSSQAMSWKDNTLGVGSINSGYTLNRHGDLISLPASAGTTPQDYEENEGVSNRKRGRSGMSFGFGIGAMIALEEDAYGGIGADFYPEFQMVWDISALQLALTVGYVYRSVEESYYSGGYYEYWDYYSLEYHYLPIFFSIGFMPIRIGKPNSLFQIYLAEGPGVYLAAGDGETHFATATKLGFEFYFGEFFVMDLEARYVWVLGAESQEISSLEYDYYYGYDYTTDTVERDMSYFNIQMGFRFRIPFVRRTVGTKWF